MASIINNTNKDREIAHKILLALAESSMVDELEIFRDEIQADLNLTDEQMERIYNFNSLCFLLKPDAGNYPRYYKGRVILPSRREEKRSPVRVRTPVKKVQPACAEMHISPRPLPVPEAGEPEREPTYHRVVKSTSTEVVIAPIEDAPVIHTLPPLPAELQKEKDTHNEIKNAQFHTLPPLPVELQKVKDDQETKVVPEAVPETKNDQETQPIDCDAFDLSPPEEPTKEVAEVEMTDTDSDMPKNRDPLARALRKMFRQSEIPIKGLVFDTETNKKAIGVYSSDTSNKMSRILRNKMKLLGGLYNNKINICFFSKEKINKAIETAKKMASE